MPKIDSLLQKLLQAGGSDLLLASGSPPIIRIHGTLTSVDSQPVPAKDVEALAREILCVEDKEKLPAQKNVDFAYEMIVDGGALQRFRANAYYQKNGLNLVMRAIPNKIPTLQDLGLPQSLSKLTNYHQGLVLATGPAGSGKTATLAAMINIINEKKPVHIITVEDPIEYVQKSKRALINQRQVGLHVESFALALKSALREDPDIILVGELRDLETIQLAITASETGHLVFGTLHTNSAAKTVNRLIDAFPVEQQPQIRTMLADSLRGIIAQQLVPKTDGSGRAVAVEILYVTLSVSNMIREGKTYQLASVMQTGKSLGMQLMDSSLMDLVKTGKISKDEAVDRAIDKESFTEQMAKVGVS